MEDTEQRGPGIENGSEWSNGTDHFNRTGPTEQRGPPRKVDRFFRNFSSWTEPIHSVLDRNFRKFWLNGSRPIGLPSRYLDKFQSIMYIRPLGFWTFISENSCTIGVLMPCCNDDEYDIQEFMAQYINFPCS